MNIIKHQKMLPNENWKQTDYYEICCMNEGLGCAFFTTLDKRITDNAVEAIIYILQRMIIEGECWDETLQQGINKDNFVRFAISAGYVRHEEGWIASAENFCQDYQGITGGIISQEKFEITKNGVKIDDIFLVQKSNILSVICFDNKWNSIQYLVETKTEWALFTWSTGA